MTVQISQRGKEYLEIAQTLLRAAKSMTDSAIAGQLKALADDYQRRAEKASHDDAAKAFVESAPNAEGEWRTWDIGNGLRDRGAVGPEDCVDLVLGNQLLIKACRGLFVRLIVVDYQFDRPAEQAALRVQVLLTQQVALAAISALDRVSLSRDRHGSANPKRLAIGRCLLLGVSRTGDAKRDRSSEDCDKS